MNKNSKGNGVFTIIFSIIFFGFFISIYTTMINSIRPTGNTFVLLPLIFIGLIFFLVLIKTFKTGIKNIKNSTNQNQDPTLNYKVQEVKQDHTIIGYCEICGNELEAKDTYCSSCGCKVKK